MCPFISYNMIRSAVHAEISHFGAGELARDSADIDPVDTWHTTLIPLVTNILRACELVPHLQDI